MRAPDVVDWLLPPLTIAGLHALAIAFGIAADPHLPRLAAQAGATLSPLLVALASSRVSVALARRRGERVGWAPVALASSAMQALWVASAALDFSLERALLTPVVGAIVERLAVDVARERLASGAPRGCVSTPTPAAAVR